MSPPEIDVFVAVDWSGAKGPAYDGIAVATCRLGTHAPTLVGAPGRRWRRADFVDWLAAQAQRAERVLVGIDCAFALPALAAEQWLGADYHVAALWDYIDRCCEDAVDFYGGDFADRTEHQSQFWRIGKRPDRFQELHRAGELACRAAGLGAPESPLKLVGARQVGKGGIAGMRVLASLRRTLGDDFRVWPFDSPERAQMICVELYPRLFMRMTEHGNTKVRSWDALQRCLMALDSEPYGGTRDLPSDHETDALVAAAGLRRIASDPAVWNPPGLDALERRAEGWIFGVR